MRNDSEIKLAVHLYKFIVDKDWPFSGVVCPFKLRRQISTHLNAICATHACTDICIDMKKIMHEILWVMSYTCTITSSSLITCPDVWQNIYKTLQQNNEVYLNHWRPLAAKSQYLLMPIIALDVCCLESTNSIGKYRNYFELICEWIN